MKIRCMTAKQNGLWVAMSLDFGLAAQADNEIDATNKLNEQIKEYIIEAINQDKPFQNKLLKRKGPVSWFVIYYWTLVKIKIAHNGRHVLFSKNTSDYVSHA